MLNTIPMLMGGLASISLSIFHDGTSRPLAFTVLGLLAISGFSYLIASQRTTERILEMSNSFDEQARGERRSAEKDNSERTAAGSTPDRKVIETGAAIAAAQEEETKRKPQT
jgi:hypothetical protein